MQWLGLVPWWIWVPYLVLWLYVMVTLIMEDREPADTLAWAFALLLVPLLGMIFYFIAGRDWATISEKKKWMRDYYEKLQVTLRPFFERNAAADRRFRQRLRRHLRRAPERHHVPRGRPRRRDRRPRRDLPHRRREVRPPQGRPRGRAALHPRAVLHLGGRRADRRAYGDPEGARAGRRPGALPLRLPRQQALGQDEARGARPAGGQGGEGRRLDLTPELPRPPQDRRHRRRDRLHRRLQRRPGVHRRRRALRGLARHTCARHRPGRRRAGGAVRGPLVRPDQGGRVHRRVPPRPAGRRERRGRHPLSGHRAVR